jgi:D-aminopeptidase
MSARCRARSLGLDMGLLPAGPLNAITDVPGVLVGHATLIEGDAVRTGVTAVLPHSDNVFENKVIAATHTLNGYGKAMGFEQIREVGTLEAPILICSTLQVGRVADAVVSWLLDHNPELGRGLGTCNPVVGECFDGYLNDARSRPICEQHVRIAIDEAAAGPVIEGNVGAGTGMSGYGFKGGVGTSSRRVGGGDYTVGALVVLNCGERRQLLVAGVRVGLALADWSAERGGSGGSIIMVVATDAPLSSRQLGRLARRAPLGLGRTGAVATHSSGDFVIAFSTAQRQPHQGSESTRSQSVLVEETGGIDELFQATVEAVEESVLNALSMAQTMVGREGHVRHALPLREVAGILQAHGHANVRYPPLGGMG